MKQLIIILLSFIPIFSTCQIINGGFEEWVLIEPIADDHFDYENPIGWKTENYTDFTLLFSPTSVTKTTESYDGEYAARLGLLPGIDGLFTSFMSQVISTDKLSRISTYIKCDSIFSDGECIIQLYDNSKDSILFIHRITTQSDSYEYFEIDANEYVADNVDSVRLVFVALGEYFVSEPNSASYASMLIDNVQVEYSSSANENIAQQIPIFPNPVKNILNIGSNPNLVSVDIKDIQGRRIFYQLNDGENYNVDMSSFPTGLYILKINTIDGWYYTTKILKIE